MENENRDRVRDQGSPDRPLNNPTPGHEGDDRTDPRRTREDREDDDGDDERQVAASRSAPGQVSEDRLMQSPPCRHQGHLQVAFLIMRAYQARISRKVLDA